MLGMLGEGCNCWIVVKGSFPLTVLISDDSQFPIDISSVKRDHDFLDRDLVEPLCRHPRFDLVTSPPLCHALISYSKSRDPQGAKWVGGAEGTNRHHPPNQPLFTDTDLLWWGGWGGEDGLPPVLLSIKRVGIDDR
ncbi:hypothetical protein PAMP_007136 [Pampus punctatissimus]